MSHTDTRKDLVKEGKKFFTASVTIDHYFGLIFCFRLRQGIQRSIDLDRIREYVIYFFENHLLDHLEEEERLVLCNLNKNSEIKRRAEKHFQNLRKAYYKLRVKKNSIRRIELIVRYLEDYIRYEERVLFSHVSKKICSGNLVKLKKRLSEKHQWIQNHWFDHFWEENQR